MQRSPLMGWRWINIVFLIVRWFYADCTVYFNSKYAIMCQNNCSVLVALTSGSQTAASVWQVIVSYYLRRLHSERYINLEFNEHL